MTKLTKTIKTREYILVPVDWLEGIVRISDLCYSDKEQHADNLIGYASSAEILLKTGKRVKQ